MVFEFTNTNGFRRVLDYKKLTTDFGLYVLNSNLYFYPVSLGTGAPIAAGEYVHVVVTRNAVDSFKAYVNGCLHLAAEDALGRAITDATNKIVFFKDNGGENSAGSVSVIHLYDFELSEAQVVARYNAFYPSTTNPNNPNPPVRDVYEYLFDNDFTETNGKPVDLIPLSTGSFGLDTFSNCGVKTVYNFDQNSGLRFDNAAANNFIDDNYTIEFYFQFQNMTGWRRLVDFKNRKSDTGPYAFNNRIQFFPTVTSGTFPLNPSIYSHLVLTRQTSTSGGSACVAPADSATFNMYVDGLLRATFNDNTDLAVLDVDQVLQFFVDDLVFPNEASAGSIALLRLYNYVLVPSDVANSFGSVPCPILLDNPTTLLHAVRENLSERVLLTWDNEQIPENAMFSLEFSKDAIFWEGISDQMPWQQTHLNTINNTATNSYYRLRIDVDQRVLYSNVVSIAPFAVIDVHLYPNPVKSAGTLVIASRQWSPDKGMNLEIIDALGRVILVKTIVAKPLFQVALPHLPVGVYTVKITDSQQSVSKVSKLIIE